MYSLCKSLCKKKRPTEIPTERPTEIPTEIPIEIPKYIRPTLYNDTPNNTNIKPVFQLKWKTDGNNEEYMTINWITVMKYDNIYHVKYRYKFYNFCTEAINNIVHPWAKQLNGYYDINDWEMDSLIIGRGYYKDRQDGDYSDCTRIYDMLPNGDMKYGFDAVVSSPEKDDPKLKTFDIECEKKLIELYLLYFPNDK